MYHWFQLKFLDHCRSKRGFRNWLELAIPETQQRARSWEEWMRLQLFWVGQAPTIARHWMTQPLANPFESWLPLNPGVSQSGVSGSHHGSLPLILKVFPLRLTSVAWLFYNNKYSKPGKRRKSHFYSWIILVLKM